MPFLTEPEIFLNRSRGKEENGLSSCSLLGGFGPGRSPRTTSRPGAGTSSTPINSAGLHRARGDGEQKPSTDLGVIVTWITLPLDSIRIRNFVTMKNG